MPLNVEISTLQITQLYYQVLSNEDEKELNS